MRRWPFVRTSFGTDTDHDTAGTAGKTRSACSSVLDGARPPSTERPITPIRTSGAMTTGSRALEPTRMGANSAVAWVMAYEMSMKTFFVSV